MADALKKPEPTLYDLDFYAWTQDQAAKLRARAIVDNRGDVDWENVAEEIESVGRSDKKEIRSRLGVLLKHLLKWRFQPSRRSESWLETINQQRLHIDEALADSPSLAAFPAETLEWSYRWSVRNAARETGLPQATFPSICPFGIDDILDPDYLPEAE